MAILCDKKSKVIVQGMTGGAGQFHTERMLAYGTQVVGGTSPGKGGEKVSGKPVFDTVAECVEATGADVSIIFLPAKFVKEAAIEAIRAGIKFLGVVPEPQALEDMSSDDDSPGLLRFVADPNAPCPLERTVDRELREKVEGTLSVLTDREEEIIRLRFGSGRAMPYTLEEIGRVMGLSRERVRQIEATALKKIQAAEESNDLREFLA